MLGTMPLSLIAGPPNSGRAGEIRRRFTELIEADPVLVVPTRDDAERFERELCDGAEAVVGGSVRTFPWLFEDIARAAGAERARRLTAAQRLALVRWSVRVADLGLLRASAATPGFAPAAERLIGELQAAEVDPTTLETRAADEGDGAYEAELAAIYRGYEELRDRLGTADRHSLAATATAAMRADPDSWGRRPVLLYGFDDLTGEELELVRALAEVCEVTVAVTYEDRSALAARAGLLARLRDELGGRVARELGADRSHTASETLFHLERNLFEPVGAVRDPDGGLVLLEAAGERAEAEQIGGEIARLLDSGTDPDEIAVVLRSPDRHGPLFDEVLSGLGIPVAVDASIPFSRTATGRALLALLRTAGDGGTAADVLAVLRTPGRARADQVDWLERDVRRGRLRTAAEALEAWRERAGWAPSELERLRRAGGRGLCRAVAEIARELAERPHRRAAARPGRSARLELRAGWDASATLDQIAELPGARAGEREVVETLEELRVPLWRGSAEGMVRVLSPYRVRARRVRHLFVASLQDGEFPTHDPTTGGGALLGDERRAALGLPPRRDPEHEERYLFYACVSRPSERLYLSWRGSDEDGQALAPSPFLDDVRDLLPPGADGPITRRRLLDRVTFEPHEAPTPNELARSLAAFGARADHRALLGEVGVPEAVAAPLAARLREAALRAAARLPGPLTALPVLESLSGREHFGASTLEEYAVCSYRWFVGHELEPQSLDPDPEPLAQGAIVHEVLERLYRQPPGHEALPRPGDLDAWRERARELLDEVSARRGLGEDAVARVGRRRMLVLIERFLAREAESASPLRPDPELIEASFGETEGDERPALEMAGFALHGKIDRVDVAPGRGEGVVRDYKLGRQVTPAAKLEREGKLQPQLYMLALRELWGIEPLGGVYTPLGATEDPRPRGLLRKEERGGPLAEAGLVGTDFLEPEAFAQALDGARERAARIVAAMRDGVIDRDPIDDRCPSYCRFQPICRRERAAAGAAEPLPDEEAES
jgi:ATP-dependent helicase/DNAse subunit B